MSRARSQEGGTDQHLSVINVHITHAIVLKGDEPNSVRASAKNIPSIFLQKEAFPCLTGLLRAPLWEGLAIVFLVSQRWLDAVVVLIALLPSIVLVDRFVNLLSARWPLWRSKADLPLVMLLFTKLRARSHDAFPSVAEGDALRRRSLLVSKTITSFARYPERRPAGVVPACDGSLDVDQLWVCW